MAAKWFRVLPMAQVAVGSSMAGVVHATAATCCMSNPKCCYGASQWGACVWGLC